MRDKKRDEYLKEFSDSILNEIFDESDAAMWTPNEFFDVGTWIFNGFVEAISEEKIVPLEELKRRVQEKMKENIDDVFQQLADFYKEEQHEQ